MSTSNEVNSMFTFMGVDLHVYAMVRCIVSRLSIKTCRATTHHVAMTSSAKNTRYAKQR